MYAIAVSYKNQFISIIIKKQDGVQSSTIAIELHQCHNLMDLQILEVLFFG
jgi:hypothetical protein